MLRHLVRPVDASDQRPRQSISPDDYFAWTDQAAAAIPDGLREALDRAEQEQSENDQKSDARLIAHARDYVDLHESVESSVALLNSLESFLATFQRDLSAVSGHISDLQWRSKSIDSKLHTRKALESYLSPLVSQLVIPPDLINLIMDTEPSQAWLTPIIQLEAKLSAIRSGPRVSARKNLDDAADKLRIKAADKIRQLFIDILKPYRTSITPSLPHLQQHQLSTLRPLFAFLQRHAPRQAHEVQKAYVAAVAWYYETGFRRYTRALEAVSARSASSSGLASGATAADAEQGLSAMFQRNFSTLSLAATGSGAAGPPSISAPASGPTSTTQQAIIYSSLEGGPAVIVAAQADDPSLHASPEALFRSISLVLADNAASEFDFISRFFGRPEDLARPSETTQSDLTTSFASSSFTKTFDSNEDLAAVAANLDSEASSVNDETASAIGTEVNSTAGMSRQRSNRSTISTQGESKEAKMKRSAAEHIWKQVMEGPLEYCKSFVLSILSRPLPATSILSMVRLNGAVMHRLIHAQQDLNVEDETAEADPAPTSATAGTCPPMESYLMGIKMDLWPLFQKEVGGQVEQVKQLTSAASAAPSASASFFGSGARSGIKDAAVSAVVKKYISLFNSVTQLTTEEDEDMVFASMGRLRGEIEKLVVAQGAAMADQSQAPAYKASQYQELLSGVMSGIPSHPRAQKEIAHFRELSRRI